MDTKKQKEQEDKLKELAKKPTLTEEARKAVNEKLKGVTKPFSK